MKYQVKRITALLLAIVLVAGALGEFPAKAEEPNTVTMLLDSCTKNNQTYTLNEQSRIFVVSIQEPTGELLQTAQLIQQQLAAGQWPDGNTMALVWGPESRTRTGDLVLKLDAGADLVADGYQMNVSDRAVITACDTDGLLYGANTLMKCFRSGNSTTVQGFTAESEPDAKERTVHLDIARKYYTPEWIMNFIRQMSWMGYNALELHFSEDGGFRADFWDDKYYTEGFQPQNDFSWICGSRMQYWVHGKYRKDPDEGKYLTTEQMLDIIETAKQYHIEIIPSFDSPAHMNYLTWKFNDHYSKNKDYSFNYDGKIYYAKECNGDITAYDAKKTDKERSYRAIDINEPVAKAFTFALYSDIADFFRTYAGSTKFNIGGDEVPLKGAKWGYKSFPGYVNELNAMLNQKGYTCRMYNDFIGAKANEDYYGQLEKNIEIVYWYSDYDPNIGAYANKLWSAKDFWKEGRTVYNGIQTSTYYVLRVSNSPSYQNMDARNPQNRNWPFYHATEDRIFNEWKPAYIRSCGDNGKRTFMEKVEPVPETQLGGGYFMIWNDYAALNTETEVWEGAPDDNNPQTKYYLLDRMWSNISKMWYSELNSRMEYKDFRRIREQLGYFPGYISCSGVVSLPAASNPVQAFLADHSALESALLAVKPDIGYTADSWALYEQAISKARDVNSNPDATQAEVDEAYKNLKAAEEGLTIEQLPKEPQVTVKLMCDQMLIKEHKFQLQEGQTNFNLYIPGEVGYWVTSIKGAKFKPLKSGDGSGFVQGKITGADSVVELICEERVDVTRLQYLVEHSVGTDIAYTNRTSYDQALQEAKEYLNGQRMTQSTVNQLVKKLEESRSSLTVECPETKILEIEPLAAVFTNGCQVGLRITTTPDVDKLTIDEVADFTLCVGEVQKLTTGETVKVWLVEFPVETAGEKTFTLRFGKGSQEIKITVV